MIEMIGTVLGSTVVAAVISGVVALITSRRQGNLQYITAERKEWREEIRKVASDLWGASYEDTMKALTRLKVRINAFGNCEGAVKYSQDAHIWQLIFEMEGNRKPSSLKLQQNQMVEYLALLLKDDWERSKKEVKGDIFEPLGIILLFVSGATIMIPHFIFNQDNMDLLIWGATVCFSFMILVPFIQFVINQIDTMCKNLIVGEVKKKSKEYKEEKLWMSYAYWGVGFLAMNIPFVYIVCNLLKETNSNEMNELILLFSIGVYTIAILLLSWTRIANLRNIYNYNKAIYTVRKKYQVGEENPQGDESTKN